MTDDRWDGWSDRPHLGEPHFGEQDADTAPAAGYTPPDNQAADYASPDSQYSVPPSVAPMPQEPVVPPPSAHDLSTSRLLRAAPPPPTGGWRRVLFDVTGGRVNVGNSAKEQRRLALIRQVDNPLRGCHRIAILSLKGGVGKTTIAAALGSTFSAVRGDRVIAVDANPDRGTLSSRVPLETEKTVRDLLRDARDSNKYSDIRAFTSQNHHRLEVLASESDPAMSEAFDAYDYESAVGILERFYNVVLTDCGTGLLHSAMRAILRSADSLIIVSSGSVDGARSASATMDWLDAHGYRNLVEQSLTVVNMVRPGTKAIDVSKIVDHFGQRCRAVRVIPYDEHLAQGAEVDLDAMAPATRTALLETAAAMTAEFPLFVKR
ncbi:MinD/ParA family ATP-binding protein [Rhodococcus sp. MEB064]|uniref:MinD/ParA family ATP-binding protein n=1 Tax=Rhodococcus sp. MEB064 TaxID=1587522 RepID=UPI000ABF88A6|nr:MinD/ParA family protein [Rhodococcus sp. MEB064]